MSKTNLSELMGRIWKPTEANDWQALADFFTPDTEFRLGPNVFRGYEGFVGMCDAWWKAFPDLKHEIVSEIESGDIYACELAMHGTHTGPMQTPQGALPATGKRVRMASCDYVVVKNGKITSWHAYPDMAGLMAQLTG